VIAAIDDGDQRCIAHRRSEMIGRRCARQIAPMISTSTDGGNVGADCTASDARRGPEGPTLMGRETPCLEATQRARGAFKQLPI
jgi:hypothetical protein